MAYPTEVDAIQSTPSGAATLGGSSPTHTQHHQQLHAAIASIRAALGDTITPVVALTQAQYDALNPPDSGTLYVIIPA